MRFFTAIILLLLLSFAVSAEHYYQADSLEVEVSVQGRINLISEKSSARLQDVSATLNLYPLTDYRQELVRLDTDGETQGNTLKFTWNDQQIEPKEFGYVANIKTKNERTEVTRKVPFPISSQDLQGVQQYLQPTASIDSDNPAVIARAAALAEGEDDLFKVAFKVANWVDTNVEYDLNSLTATASQKASWVLENREGVCDEMTSLFIAMMRSLGVPARFVSGVSYTTSDLFDKPWQPHGWAEVYFPDVGWVSFDIAFGQYGYVDVTHIKLRDSADPQDPASEYYWRSDGVALEAEELDIDVKVLDEGDTIPEEVLLEEELLSGNVGFGSYNLVKGILKNTKEYYAASTLQLAIPTEVEIRNNNRRTIMLHPLEVRETYWILKVHPNLNPQYEYTIPVVLYSEENVSVRDSFFTQSEGTYYTQEEIEALAVQDEEKSYSRKVSFNCHYPREMKVGAQAVIECSIKNSGNANLDNVEFCVGDVCEIVDLFINQRKNTSITVQGDTPGMKKVIVSAQNELIEKSTALEYAVLDSPLIAVEVFAPQEMSYGKEYAINISLRKSSYATPREVVVIAEGRGFENRWEIAQLPAEETITLNLGKEYFGMRNKYQITTLWKDKAGMIYSETQDVMIKGNANRWNDRFRMIANSILGWFL